MTERPTDRRRRPSRALPVYSAVGATFALAGGGIGLQMVRGHDPALGVPARAAAAPASPPVSGPRRIVVRRVVKTTVITRVVRDRSTPSTGGGAIRAVPASAVQAPAPAARPAVPAPVPAAAPAPAPAPATVTRSS